MTFAALWASLPELPQWPSLIGPACTVLAVSRETVAVPESGAFHTTTGHSTADNSWSIDSGVGIAVDRIPDDGGGCHALIEQILAPYPTAAGWSIHRGARFISGGSASDPTQRIVVMWTRTDEHGNAVVIAPELLTEKHDGTLFLRPGVGRNRVVPSPLITWWGLLLALSSLARYEPVIWRRALDIDTSPIAWPLEQGLRIAERRIPELVLHAITSS